MNILKVRQRDLEWEEKRDRMHELLSRPITVAESFRYDILYFGTP